MVLDFFLKTGKQVAAMILLDIAAPICLLLGLRSESAANVSLLNNFEIVATALIALAVFKEKISLRLWAGILFPCCLARCCPRPTFKARPRKGLRGRAL